MTLSLTQIAMLTVNSVYSLLSIVFFSSFEIYIVVLTSVPSLTIGTPIIIAFMLLKYTYVASNYYTTLKTAQKQSEIKIWRIINICMASFSTLLVIAGCVVGPMTGMIFSQLIVHPIMLDIMGLSLFSYCGLVYVFKLF